MTSSYHKFKILLKIGNAVEVKAQQRILSYYDNKYTISNKCNNNQYDFKKKSAGGIAAQRFIADSST
jgi:hypothetical protein